jgi:hypothetical protein
MKVDGGKIVLEAMSVGGGSVTRDGGIAACGGAAGWKTIHTGLSSTERESSRTF